MAPKVFISYAHNQNKLSYSKEVLEFSNRLRENGVDANIDQYEEIPI